MIDQTVIENEQLECNVCLREIPRTVGNSVEGDEYVSHYCGLDCYQKWRDMHRSEAATTIKNMV